MFGLLILRCFRTRGYFYGYFCEEYAGHDQEVQEEDCEVEAQEAFHFLNYIELCIFKYWVDEYRATIFYSI